MEFSKLTFFMAFVLLIQYGETKESKYNMTATGIEYMNGTKDCCFDFSNLVFANDDITGTFDLLVDITHEKTNYEGQIKILKKNPQTGEFEHYLSLGPEPWCELYTKVSPLLADLKKTADLPEKCPISKGTYVVKEAAEEEDEEDTDDFSQGEYAMDCTLLIDGQVVSGVRVLVDVVEN